MDELAEGETARLETPLRKPCRDCGSEEGIVRRVNGQYVARCANCGAYAGYSVPRHELGLAARTIRTRPTISPGTRHHVLERWGYACAACGRRPTEHHIILVVDHIIPVAPAQKAGLYDEIIETNLNLAAFCEECNNGKSDMTNASMRLIILALHLDKVYGRKTA